MRAISFILGRGAKTKFSDSLALDVVFYFRKILRHTLLFIFFPGAARADAHGQIFIFIEH